MGFKPGNVAVKIQDTIICLQALQTRYIERKASSLSVTLRRPKPIVIQ